MPAFAAAVPMSMKKPMRQLADEIMGDHRSMLVRAPQSRHKRLKRGESKRNAVGAKRRMAAAADRCSE